MSSARDKAQRDALRGLLARALVRRWQGRLCRSEDESNQDLASLMSVTLMSLMLAGLVWFLWLALNLFFWVGLAALLGFMILLAVLAQTTGRLGSLYLFIVLLWCSAGIYQLVTGGLSALAETHGAGIAVVVGGLLAFRALRLVSSVPFLLPVAILFVIAPLLTADLWQVAEASGPQLGFLALVTVVPSLTVVLIRLVVRLDVADVFRTAGTALADQDDPVDRALDQALAVDDTRVASVDRARVRELVASSFTQQSALERSLAVGARLRPAFRRQTLYRLVGLIVGTAASIGGFTYLLAWSAVPVSTATGWIGEAVPLGSLQGIGIDASFPCGPYIMVAVVLAIVGTAAFLAFVLTEARYSNVLTHALVNGPAERTLLLALPFIEAGGDIDPDA